MDTCDYCGGVPVRGWQGNAKWCDSDACWQRHQNATCEPRFYLPPQPPTLWQMAGIRVALAFFRCLEFVVPIRWLVDEPESRRGRVAIWVYGGGWGWAERLEGRL